MYQQVVRLTGQAKVPVILFTNGEEMLVRRERFTLRRGAQVVACRTQLPLELGWAISIHKSQGMTLDAVEMDLSSVFECGQVRAVLCPPFVSLWMKLIHLAWSGIRSPLASPKFGKPSFDKQTNCPEYPSSPTCATILRIHLDCKCD